MIVRCWTEMTCHRTRHQHSLLYRKANMSAPVLLNLLNNLRKREKCETCRAFYRLFTKSLMFSSTQGHDAGSYKYIMTWTLFCNCVVWCKTRQHCVIYTPRCPECNFIKLPKSVNHLWFIDFKTWRLIINNLSQEYSFEK